MVSVNPAHRTGGKSAIGTRDVGASIVYLQQQEGGALFTSFRGWEPLVLALLLVVYFVPTYIALGRKHPQKVPILLLNTLAGWTVVGWVGALIWSLIPAQTPATAPPTPVYRAGDIVNGHRFDGQVWTPIERPPD